MNAKSRKPAGLLRRLGAMLYDSLLLFAVLMFATAVLMLATKGVSLLSTYEYLPIDEHPFLFAAYQLYLLGVTWLYFAWQWVRGGFTLGMKTWHLSVERLDGDTITWQQSGVRFVLAMVSLLCLGMGFWWILVDKEKRAWHDIGSRSRMVKF